MGNVSPRVIHEKQSVNRGTESGIRGDFSGGQVVSFTGTGRFGEAALKGTVFHAGVDTQTIAAGNLVGASAAATTNTGLFNPTTSTSVLVLLRVSVAIQSGTPTAGSIYHGTQTGHTVATTITGMARGKNGLPSSNQLSQGWYLDSNAGVTLTGGAAPATYGSFGVGLSAAAMTTGLLIGPVVDELDGAIVLAPGDAYLPLFTGAGTTVIANFGYTWMEVPYATQ